MLNWITYIIESMRYGGIALLTFLENIFPPIPSEVVIPLAGFVAAQGDLRIGMVIVTGTCGSLAGAGVWYAVGSRMGEKLGRSRDDRERNGHWLCASAVEGSQ